MNRARPSFMVPQRDSDAKKDIEASRSSALNRFSILELRTGSALVDQFQMSYIPRVSHMTLPWQVGGPDLKGVARFRRKYNDAPPVSLDTFTKMMARRVEAQMRWDWGMNPALWSLVFASKVNLGVSMSSDCALRRGDASEASGQSI